MARRSGLGKGLGALIPTEVAEQGGGLRDIPISQVRPNRFQPRQHFDEESLVGLTDSVREIGVLQPVLVRSSGEGFELIAGERRWRAAKRAGLQTIPAIVRETEDAGSLEQALVENLHRDDLNPLEEAAAYQQLIEDFGLTQEQVAARVGKSRSAVSNTLRLFQLPPAVQRLVGEGALSEGHARALLGTPDRAYQEALAKRAVKEELSVRAVEESVRQRGESVAEPPEAASHRDGRSTPRLRPPGLLELEQMLAEYLATRVSVSMGAKRGRVVIEFADLEDLERLFRVIVVESA